MSGRNPGERMQTLLAAYLEDELSPEEVREVEEHLASHPEDRHEVAFQRAFMRRLGELGMEEVPAGFSGQVMERAPALPGSLAHRFELLVSRWARPMVLAGAAAFAVWMVASPLTPGPSGTLPPPLTGGPAQALALLEVGPEGGSLGRTSLPAEGRKALGSGQVVHLAFGAPSTLRFPGGVTARIQGGTTFSIADREILLEEGKVRVSVTPGVGDFTVRGPQASAHVIGTEFEVRAGGGETAVAVHEGVVEVRSPGETPVRLTRGQSARADRDAGLERLEGALPTTSTDPASPPSGSPEGVPPLDTSP